MLNSEDVYLNITIEIEQSYQFMFMQTLQLSLILELTNTYQKVLSCLTSPIQQILSTTKG